MYINLHNLFDKTTKYIVLKYFVCQNGNFLIEKIIYSPKNVYTNPHIVD